MARIDGEAATSPAVEPDMHHPGDSRSREESCVMVANERCSRPSQGAAVNAERGVVRDIGMFF